MPELIKPMFHKMTKSLLAFLFVLVCHSAAFAAPDGKALFMSNCASCHNPIKESTGPALKGVSARVPSKEWLHNWIHNSAALIKSGDKYANDIYAKYNKTAMTAFPNLSVEEIDAIIEYCETYEPPTPTPGPDNGGGSAASSEDNTWMYVVITISLLVLSLILWRANAGLKRLADAKEGRASVKEIPFIRNKVFIALGVIVLIILAGYWITNGGVQMNRQENYMPEQPIFYSHKVHAGINQINCLYCHSGAEKSRQAMIPSTNVCMNCHKQISEYTGAEEHPLVTYEGKKIDGTAEIQKLYAYAGWDPVKKEYKRKPNGEIDAKPIQWVKIHNLPDHVYFNHQQHVAVGKVQCQQCHGNIEEMDEVFQFSPLSMGWCVNCHRQTAVQFANNDYYSIFTKYHEEIKSGKREKVTVEDIGGLECQRCHY